MRSLDFPHWLRQRRKLFDLTQAQLAQQVGASAVTIRKLEAGERKPSQELARLLGLALHLPEREHAAFIRFARAGDQSAALPLPAWEADQPVWRRAALPPAGPPAAPPAAARLTLHYDLYPAGHFCYHAAPDGSQFATIETAGPVSGDLEGSIHLRITQLIKLKPTGFDYSMALAMPLGALFRVRTGEATLEGSYTGVIAPALDSVGNGEAHVQGAGRIVAATADLADFFLDYVFVEDIVRMVEGQGAGATGMMRLVAPGA